MKMNKKTKIEIVIIIIAAIIYFASMLTGRGTAGPQEVPTTQAAVESQAIIPLIDQSTQISQGSAVAASIVEADAGGSDETTDETDVQSIETAGNETETVSAAENENGADAAISEDGHYTDKESVALYIYTYGHLPENYITKNEAKDAGWDSAKGNLPEVCPGMSIGGDKFSNYEKQLPTKKGRKYFECDINFDENKGFRGAERIIFSNDGLVYYTGDHYKNFELLYGEP